MNRSHPFAIISSALLLLCAVLASCSKDADSSARGERLPEGRYPIEFTAEGVEMEPFTRATVDGDWDGVESVAVWVCSRGNDVKRYSVTSTDGGKTAKLTSDDPFWWEYSGEMQSVMAWSPYSDYYPSAWTVKADQSAVENYRASDLVEGRNSDLSFAERNDPSKNKITFVHQTSKIVVNLVAGPGVILGENTSVKLLNVGRVETGNTVTAYRPDAAKQSFHALLAGRQTITAGAPFIQVNVGSNVFVYTPSAERQLIANTSYTYTITVKAHGIEVKEAAGGEWTDGSSEDVSSISITHYTAADLKIGDYYYSDGTWSDGGLRKLYSDGTMKWENTAPQSISGKTVIGIVFYVGHHPNDNSDYSGSGIGQQKCRGYVVALTDVHKDENDRPRWEYGPNKEYNLFVGTSGGISDWQGYDNSLKFHEFINKNTGWEMKHFPAALACETYGNRTFDGDGNPTAAYGWQKQLTAPDKTSGWFLPSLGQLSYLYEKNSLLSARMTEVKNNTPSDCNYKNYIKWFSTTYWSSSERSPGKPNLAYYMYFVTGKRYESDKRKHNVRAVLAF